LVGFDETWSRITFASIEFDLVTALAFDLSTGTLYGADDATDQLLLFDQVTGDALPIGPLGFRRVSALGFDPTTNSLYGVDSWTTELFRIDVNTGSRSPVGPTGYVNIRGLAFVPADCNDNMIPDECDLSSGASTDMDFNSLPDECEPPQCGDGVLSEGEQCDGGQGNSNTIPNACRTNCSLAGCGDHVIDTGEQCDDGTANSDSFWQMHAEPTACSVIAATE
jgi:hypothetical protein